MREDERSRQIQVGMRDDRSVAARGRAAWLARPRLRRGGPTALGTAGAALLIPSLLMLAVIVGVPFCLAIYISFIHLTEANISTWLFAPFAGFGNYAEILIHQVVVGSSLLQSLWISVAFACLTTIIILPIGTLAALSCDGTFRGRALIRSVYLLPYVMPHVVTAIMGRLVFSTGGLVDRATGAFHLGGSQTVWLLGPRSFWAMLAVEVWATWGLIYLLVLAGLQSVDRQMYEAAEIDGARRWRKFISITLPSLRNVLALSVVLSTMFHFANFTLAFVMFGTSPPPSAFVLPLNLYVAAFDTYNFGAASAGAVLMVLIIMIPVALYIRILRVAPSSVSSA